MKKITIIFGGNVGVYVYHFKTIKAIEDSLKCKIKRTGHFSFSTKVKNIFIDITFCYGPIKDGNYLKRKELFALNEKEIIPQPAEIIAKKIGDTSLVLLLGLCGGLKGNKSEIYLPTEFREILFEQNYIKKEKVLPIKKLKRISLHNYLLENMPGKKASALTSNLTFQPKSIEKENTELLLDITNSLSKSIDVIDKESYQIVEKLKEKYPIGVMLMASDVLNKKRFMLKGNFKPNIKKFNANCVRAIKVSLKRI